MQSNFISRRSHANLEFPCIKRVPTPQCQRSFISPGRKSEFRGVRRDTNEIISHIIAQTRRSIPSRTVSPLRTISCRPRETKYTDISNSFPVSSLHKPVSNRFFDTVYNLTTGLIDTSLKPFYFFNRMRGQWK